MENRKVICREIITNLLLRRSGRNLEKVGLCIEPSDNGFIPDSVADTLWKALDVSQHNLEAMMEIDQEQTDTFMAFENCLDMASEELPALEKNYISELEEWVEEKFFKTAWGEVVAEKDDNNDINIIGYFTSKAESEPQVLAVIKDDTNREVWEEKILYKVPRACYDCKAQELIKEILAERN